MFSIRQTSGDLRHSEVGGWVIRDLGQGQAGVSSRVEETMGYHQ